MVVDRRKPKVLVLLYLAPGPLTTAANSSDVPTQFAGGDQFSVPYTVPMMSTLSIDWFRFSVCYSYVSQFFGFTKCFCFAAKHNKNEVLEGKFRKLGFSPFTKKTTE